MKRHHFTPAAKMCAVEVALHLPEGCRIKPTCRVWKHAADGVVVVSPPQLRKWIRDFSCGDQQQHQQQQQHQHHQHDSSLDLLAAICAVHVVAPTVAASTTS